MEDVLNKIEQNYTYVLVKVTIEDDNICDTELISAYRKYSDASAKCKELNDKEARGVYIGACGTVTDFNYEIDDRLYYQVKVVEIN